MTAPLLLSVFPTFAVGGAQSRFTTLANHLGPTWRHAIVAMDGVIDARERLEEGLGVSFLRIDNRKGDLLGNVRRFRGLLNSLAPATMLTHNFGSIEWAMANRRQIVPHVHVEDGFGPEERQAQLPRRIWLRRVFLHRRPTILPSQNLLRIARTIWRLRTDDTHYIPNGVDIDRFRGSEPGHEWPGDGPVIGTVAALRPEKNIARLIRAFGIVCAQRPARLVLIGDGAQRAELQMLAAKLGLADRVHFEGHVPQPDALLASFDIFAMSSDTEQMPISLLEAMAAGRPVVATNVGDIGSMLPSAAHPFVTPCEDGALAAALLELVANPALRRELGDANQAKATKSYSQAKMLGQWSDLLEAGAMRRRR